MNAWTKPHVVALTSAGQAMKRFEPTEGDIVRRDEDGNIIEVIDEYGPEGVIGGES